MRAFSWAVCPTQVAQYAAKIQGRVVQKMLICVFGSKFEEITKQLG